jgi:GH18 family chitinase
MLCSLANAFLAFILVLVLESVSAGLCNLRRKNHQMNRPVDDVMPTESTPEIESSVMPTETELSTETPCSSGEKSAGKFIVYYTNWSTYARNFQVKDLFQYSGITDVNYAFLALKQSDKYDGHLVPIFTDPWADFDKRFTEPGSGIDPPDTWNDPEGQIYGNFGQFDKLTKQSNVSFGISIG